MEAAGEAAGEAEGVLNGVAGRAGCLVGETDGLGELDCETEAVRRIGVEVPASDPGQPPPAPFSPLVLSSGGVMERGMFEKLRAWKSFGMNSVDHAWTLSSVAISLARARGRTFVV